jgi:type I restriction enzyme S subunit
MPGEWREATIGDLAWLHDEKVTPTNAPAELFYHFSIAAYDSGQEPAVEPGCAIGSNKYVVPHGAVLVSKLNPRIPRVWAPEVPDTARTAASTEFLVLSPRDGVDRRFLKYLMLSPSVRSEMEARVTGTSGSHQRVRPSDLLKISLRIPRDLHQQRAIGHILGTLDDKIELNRRMSETLEAMARALFKSWFVDFDPVRAKMEGRWQRGQSLPGLPAHLYDLFPARLVDSELGEIPEGWEVGTLADFSTLNPEVWTQETRPGRIKYVDLSNTKWGRIEVVTSYEAAKAPSRAQRVLRPADTIVGTVRPANGSYAFISESGLTGSTGFAVLRPRTAHQAEFVYLAATAADNIETLAHLADGAAYPAVRPQVVAATAIVRPPDEVLVLFSRTAGPILAKVAQNERESRTLAALRDTLLPKLISGELRLKDAERFVERASA